MPEADTSAHRGEPEGNLTNTNEEDKGRQPDVEAATAVTTPTTQLGQPSPYGQAEETENRDNYDGTLAFDDKEDLLVPRSTDVAIDDPDGHVELALGVEPLPLDPNISELKRRKKPRKIHDAWRRKGATEPKVRKSTRVIPDNHYQKGNPRNVISSLLTTWGIL